MTQQHTSNWRGIPLKMYAVFILGLLGGELSPPKISDSPPKVVSDLITAILHQFD